MRTRQSPPAPPWEEWIPYFLQSNGLALMSLDKKICQTMACLLDMALESMHTAGRSLFCEETWKELGRTTLKEVPSKDGKWD